MLDWKLIQEVQRVAEELRRLGVPPRSLLTSNSIVPAKARMPSPMTNQPTDRGEELRHMDAYDLERYLSAIDYEHFATSQREIAAGQAVTRTEAEAAWLQSLDPYQLGQLRGRYGDRWHQGLNPELTAKRAERIDAEWDRRCAEREAEKAELERLRDAYSNEQSAVEKFEDLLHRACEAERERDRLRESLTFIAGHAEGDKAVDLALDPQLAVREAQHALAGFEPQPQEASEGQEGAR